MTLEDFFTLSEMKDGLTAPARVKELVNVMQNERDCVVKNVGDATRQWSTVASTIVATDDKECLDLFVQLNGIWFIDRWLKDAENCIGDTSQSFVEESMTALLSALLKLNIDYDKAKSCGIWLTVKNLLDHGSTKVKDKAKALFDSWKQDGDRGTVPQDVEMVKEPDTDMTQVVSDLAPGIEDSGGSPKESSLRKCDADKEKVVEAAKSDIVPPSNSGVLQPESIVDVQMQTSDKAKTFDNEVVREDCTLGPVAPPVMSDPVTASLSTMEQPPGFQVDETKAIRSCSSTIPDHGVEEKAVAPESNEVLGKSEEDQTTNLPSKLGSMLISSVSSSVDPTRGSNDCAADAQQPVTGTEIQNEKQHSYLKGSPSRDVDMVMPEEQIEKGDAGSPDNCRSTLVTADQSHHSGSDTSFSSEDSGTSSREKEQGSDETEDMANHSSFLKAEVRAQDRDVDKRSSFSELDFGMVDALEVARQVAIEVEREVTGCGDPSGSSSEAERKVKKRGEASGSSSERTSDVAREVAIEVERKVTGQGEPSGSSSERISDVAMRQPESAESVTVKEIQSIKATSKEIPPGSNLLSETTARRAELSTNLKTLGAEMENQFQDLDSSQVTEAAQDPDASSERGLGNFDLNQEISSEDMDHFLTRRAPNPISVVSASRAAAAPRLPVAPLQFEGALGWKGSAATSAFRPTMAREKPPVMEESSSSSRQREDCFDFDLNVAGTGDEPVNLVPGNTNLGLSGLPFQNSSSIQASSERSERLKLDLNLTSDDVDAPTDSRVVGRLVQHRNHHLNLSPSSSSSSMQPPAFKNFDLNDQPSHYNDPVDTQSSRGKSSSQILNSDGGLRPSNSVISLMGTRVEVNRRDFVPYVSSNGNSGFDPSFGRSGGISGMGSAVQYGQHPHLFGYNGLAAGPASSMYGPAGPVQYMVDSRGVPIVPQLMGSPSASLGGYPRPPFVMGMGMIGTPPGSNSPGLSQFDLSSGMMIDEGNRQSGGLRQFLDPGQNRSVEEHSRVSTQSFLGPSGLGKRKEPEDGWEPYPQYRNHRQPPWN